MLKIEPSFFKSVQLYFKLSHGFQMGRLLLRRWCTFLDDEIWFQLFRVTLIQSFLMSVFSGLLTPAPLHCPPPIPCLLWMELVSLLAANTACGRKACSWTASNAMSPWRQHASREHLNTGSGTKFLCRHSWDILSLALWSPSAKWSNTCLLVS